ncbi:MAG: hypothetical protein MUP81_03225 [Dehalococcoidia bacterium]|nr:hypothetical protein [Dehalococcoidia bacterium]
METITQTAKQIPKKKTHVFGKDIYLLGTDESGIRYWLESPSWDCNWYWGFGYIETYSNNRSPEHSADISSHQHAENFMSKWFTEWNGSKPILVQQTFDKKEGWELSELFEQFYFLKESAENFGRGKCHCANTIIPLWQKTELAKEINEQIIPKVTARILEILTP